MRSAKHPLPRLIAFSTLHRAFAAAAAGKRGQPEVRTFEYHLEPNLLAIRRDVLAGRYAWGALRQFEVRDPKRRVIRAAPFRDRVLHHALVDVLDPILARGFIRDTYACLRGRGTHAAVERYRAFVAARRGRGYALQCDIERYFATVDHAVLLGLLARRIGDPAVLALLASLVTHGAEEPGRGMPIGNLTSQMFANLYLDRSITSSRSTCAYATTCAIWTTFSCSSTTAAPAAAAGAASPRS